jgi:integrase
MTARPFGNIRKLPSGRYQARWQGADGKDRLGPTTFETKADARKWLSGQEADLHRGVHVDPTKGRTTVATFAEAWLAGRPDLRPRTVELYRGLLTRHIVPGLGPIELGRLDVATVRAWHAKLIRGGPGAVTVAKAYRLLRTMLNTAVEDGRIVANPCVIKGAGVEHSPERTAVPTVEQVQALAEAIEPRFRALVLFAAFSGLRFGEVAALTRSRVDLEAGAVTVAESAAELGDGTRLVGPPKTEAGRRTVALPAPVVDVLRSHLAEYVGQQDDALVFCGPKGAALRRANFHKSWWAPARAAVGLPALHFHDLRHAGNTWAAATGASTAELMGRMGHASPRAALIYQHATASRDRAIADALGDMLTASRDADRVVVPFPARRARG